MQIVLVRHAKVLMENQKSTNANEMNRWVEEYNHAPIDSRLPNSEVVSLIQNSNYKIASSLYRTEASLALLEIEPHEKNSLFNEIDLPQTKGTWLKLKPKMWLMTLRVVMLIGFGKKEKVLKEAKLRAKEASLYLQTKAKEHHSVTLLGHGGFNYLLDKELKMLGFRCIEKKSSSKNWGYRVYEN